MRDSAVDDLLDHAVGEILLLRVATHILERQRRDRRVTGQREPRLDGSRRCFGRLRLAADQFGDRLRKALLDGGAARQRPGPPLEHPQTARRSRR
jgi:hypothetical protein